MQSSTRRLDDEFGMFVGVDIGGTKTHVRVVDAAGHAADTIVATNSWQHDGLLSDARSVRALVQLFAEQVAGVDRVALAVGAHGCDSSQQIHDLHAALSTVFDGTIGVYNDAQLVGPAASRSNAIALIAGTGAIAVGSGLDGSAVTAGGHGWLLADPGSAPALARESMRAILARFDATGETDELGDRFIAAYGAENVHNLAHEFTRTASMNSWAELAPLVFSAAEGEATGRGSADAQGVIERAAIDLVALVRGLLHRGVFATAVVAAGGVVTNQPRLEDEIRRQLAAEVPELTFEVLRTPPVAGAIELARGFSRLAGDVTTSLYKLDNADAKEVTST